MHTAIISGVGCAYSHHIRCGVCIQPSYQVWGVHTAIISGVGCAYSHHIRCGVCIQPSYQVWGVHTAIISGVGCAYSHHIRCGMCIQPSYQVWGVHTAIISVPNTASLAMTLARVLGKVNNNCCISVHSNPDQIRDALRSSFF